MQEVMQYLPYYKGNMNDWWQGTLATDTKQRLNTEHNVKIMYIFF